MEDFVLDASPAVSLGKNLIADALGPDAAYSRFSPSPTKVSTSAEIKGRKSAEDPVHHAKTELIQHPPATAGRKTRPLSAADPIHSDKTALNRPPPAPPLPPPQKRAAGGRTAPPPAPPPPSRGRKDR
jgi:hypothetical protein